ncbi:hypothetical protein CFter6_1811 [Collimonas fungivorans]|uniref:Uncharacterized protein n=1 Tax=Collimonas fungivorans TaxID=158899 RepID=A0A127P9K4_9BURK|nr:hypothetical protein CFter6_1811 [Collimonas fungivorans]
MHRLHSCGNRKAYQKCPCLVIFLFVFLWKFFCLYFYYK